MFAFADQGLLRGRLWRPRADELLVLAGATLIDGTGAAPQPDTTIVLRGDRIERIVPRGSRPDLPTEPSPKRLDLAGHWIMPGMIDCHVHLTGVQGHGPGRGYLEPYPSVRVLRAVRDANRVLAAGFTTVRHLGHGDPEHAQALKEAVQSGVIAGPRLLTSGWAISQTGGHGNLRAWPYHLVEDLRPRSAFCDGPDALRKFVRRLLGDGADCIKIYTTEGVIGSSDRQMDIPNFTLAEIEAVTDEAHRRGVRVAAHATGLAGAKNAVLGGVDTLEHGPHEPDDALLRLLVDNKASLVPTLSVFQWAADEGESFGLPDWAVDRARRWMVGRRPMARAAAEAGVNLAVGTDSGGAPRGGLNARELAEMVRAEISPLQAITAATLGGARALGIDDKVGSLVGGKWADLLVLTVDPLRDIRALQDPTTIKLVFQSRPDLGAAA